MHSWNLSANPLNLFISGMENDITSQLCGLCSRRAKIMKTSQTKLDKFNEVARELECDDDEKRFDERLKYLVKHKPVELSK